MAKFFEGAYFDKPFYDNPFFHGDYYHKPFFSGIGSGSGGGTVPSVPVVEGSVVDNANTKRIIVQFDQEMRKVGDLKHKISAVVDGGTLHNPVTISFNHNTMNLTFASAFVTGTVITWAYDDSDPVITLESKLGIEADNQTYSVTNNIPSTNPAPPPEDDIVITKPKRKRGKKK